jgi:heme exporter protein B
MFWALVRRDLKLAARIGGGGAMGLVFFLSLVTVMPFAVGPDLNLLARIGAAILWVAAMLATLLGLDRIFQAEEEDGSLDLLMMSPLSFSLIVLAKGLAHWLATGLPLVLVAPLLGLLLALPPIVLGAVTLTLLVGTPALTFLGVVGAALTAGLRRGGLILPILVMPLMVPVLIFGVSASNAALEATTPFIQPLMLLVAASLFALVAGVIAGAASLRHAGGS